MRNLDYPGSHEGSMVRNQLTTISRISDALYNELEPTDQLPNWTLNNVAIAKDRLTSAMQHISSRIEQKRRDKMGALSGPSYIHLDKFMIDSYGNLDGKEHNDAIIKAYKKLSSLPYAKDMLPSDYDFKVCDCKTNPTVCLPLPAEKRLQQQRKFAYMFGGPAVAVAGFSLENPLMKYGMIALGVACTLTHYAQYHAVAKAGSEKGHDLG